MSPDLYIEWVTPLSAYLYAVLQISLLLDCIYWQGGFDNIITFKM